MQRGRRAQPLYRLSRRRFKIFCTHDELKAQKKLNNAHLRMDAPSKYVDSGHDDVSMVRGIACPGIHSTASCPN